MNPSVSIVIIYRDREKQFEQTLISIRRQNYNPLEIVVVEDGDDGGSCANFCQKYGARHIQKVRPAGISSGRHQYWTANPPFGNLPILRNCGIAAAQNDIVIFQDAEVSHDNDVILELATKAAADPKLLVNCKMKMIHEDRSWHWRSHPTEPPCPMWPHIGAPNAIQKQFLLTMGGFEETMAGYGYDDDYFFYLIRRQGWVEFSDQSESSHQFHISIPYDYPTGRANRALCARLTHEIQSDLRPPTANYRSRDVLDSEFPILTKEVLKPIILKVANNCQDASFVSWAMGWMGGTKDDHGDTAREMAEKMMQLKVEAPIMAAEAAWALNCSESATKAGALESAEHLMAWARTAATIARRGK